jgi:hypothetical protein
MDLTSVLGVVATVIDRAFPDPAQRDAAKLKLLELQQSGEMAQLAADTELAKAQAAINQTEAANPNLFVSGWRPFVGWVCGLGLAYAFLIKPIASPLIQKWCGVPMEALDISTLLTLLFGMLGLGGLRTFEKMNGVARK